jgi:hypothetical protein
MTAGEDHQEITILVMTAKVETNGDSIPAEGRDFCLSHNVKADSGFHPVLYPWCIKVLYKGIKQPESETYY